MNKLQEAIEMTDFTKEEWDIYKKVERNNDLTDIKIQLDTMLDFEEITQEEYTTLCDNYEQVLREYRDLLSNDGDWNEELNYAIKYVLKGDN